MITPPVFQFLKRHLAFVLLLLLAVQCEAQTKPPARSAPKAAPQTIAYEQLVLGKWKSVTDPKFTLTITPSAYIESSPGTPPSTLKYQLTNTCRCDDAAAVKTPTKRLLVTYETSLDDCYCYSIDRLDAQRLVLLYVGRGNKLEFQRMK